MFKFKKALKNKKGFTLIELIVVIAILGILGMLIVPRLAGFTDTAKISADENMMRLAENTVKTAMAAGDIVADGTISLTAAGVWTASVEMLDAGSVYIGANKDASITALMDALVDDAELQYYTSLDISVDVSDYDADGTLNE